MTRDLESKPAVQTIPLPTFGRAAQNPSDLKGLPGATQKASFRDRREFFRAQRAEAVVGEVGTKLNDVEKENEDLRSELAELKEKLEREELKAKATDWALLDLRKKEKEIKGTRESGETAAHNVRRDASMESLLSSTPGGKSPINTRTKTTFQQKRTPPSTRKRQPTSKRPSPSPHPSHQRPSANTKNTNANEQDDDDDDDEKEEEKDELATDLLPISPPHLRVTRSRSRSQSPVKRFASGTASSSARVVSTVSGGPQGKRKRGVSAESATSLLGNGGGDGVTNVAAAGGSIRRRKVGR